MMIPMSEIRGALARGYTTQPNKHKELDAVLIEAQAKEILQLLADHMVKVVPDPEKQLHTQTTKKKNRE